jgi:hypothetical protein
MVAAMNALSPFDRPHKLDVTIRLCPDCRRPSDGQFGVCDACMTVRESKHHDELNREKSAKLALAWKHLCPPLYQQTNWKHPGLSPACCEHARTWWANNGLGLGFYGPSGRGKTRAMWEILRRHHFAGRKVLAVSAQKIQSAVSDFHADANAERNEARKLIRDCKVVGILLIDDIGKERTSPAVASALHDIIETRFSHKRPTLWTSELTGEDLAQKLGDNYANGLTRRIRESSTIIQA